VPRLRRSDPHRPGYTRRRAGRGWVYLDADGQRITDQATVERIQSLAIPPAWRDVWICPYPNGHIQAVGTDAAGRRQYRYHDVWREHRDQLKHLKVLQVGERLPAMRRRWARDLRRDGLDRDRVLAAGPGCSTSACSGSAARSTPRRTTRTGWPRCAGNT